MTSHITRMIAPMRIGASNVRSVLDARLARSRTWPTRYRVRSPSNKPQVTRHLTFLTAKSNGRARRRAVAGAGSQNVTGAGPQTAAGPRPHRMSVLSMPDFAPQARIPRAHGDPRTVF